MSYDYYDFKNCFIEYKDFVKKSRDIIFTVNEKGELTYVSPNCKEILGYDQDEVTGKSSFEFVDSVDITKITNIWDVLLKYEYIEEEIEFRVIDKNRKRRWFSTNPVVVKKNDEKTIILNMAQDITKRKKTELELKKSEKLYRTLFENTGTATLVIEEDTTISLVNQNMVKLSGYSKDEIENKMLIGDIISPKERDRILEYHELRRKDSSKAPKNYEFTFITKYGEERYALMNIDVIPETNQSIASIIDITERKKMLEELRIKDQAIVSSIDAIAISDLEGEITYVNPSFLSMWGYENENEVIGNSIEDFLGSSKDAVEVLESLSFKDNWEGDLVDMIKNGEIINIHLSMALVYGEDEEPIGIIASYIDITQRKKATEELKKNEARLQSLVDLFQHETEDIQDLQYYAVNVAAQLTDSEFAHFYDYDYQYQEIQIYSYSSNVFNDCNVSGYSKKIKLEDAGLWADPIRQKEPVVINDYQNDDRLKKEQPEGHVEIRRYLGVPILRENKIVAVIGVANKETDYNYSDILQLRLFIDNVWEVIERRLAEKKLEEYAKELESSKRQQDEEIVKARNIHERTFLTEIPDIEGISLEAHFYPARGLGGDFYNFIRINDKLIIFLSDVSGHGLDGTIISVFVKETIESYLALKPDEINPEKILIHINNQYRRDNYPDDYFVCIFLAVLDLNTYELSYSGAGMHNTSLVRLGNGKKTVLEIQGPPISSAIPSELMDFGEGKIQLTPGTSVLFFTDGIAEQEIEGSNGVEFYEDRLKEVYFENSHLPPEILKQIIKDDFRKHNNGFLQGDDDITYALLHLDPEEMSEYSWEFDSNFEELKKLNENVFALLIERLNEECMFQGLYELVANAIEHGNKFDLEKKVVVKLKITDYYILACVFDEGEGFDWQKIADNQLDIDHDGERGRGMIMTKMMCKRLLYNEKGNEAYLIMQSNN